MGIDRHFAGVYTSALIGYEKPRKEIYQFVLDRISDRSNVWMVGDNEVADAFGAENAGIRAVLVRKKPKTFHRYIDDLIPLRTLLEQSK
jgi:putative hydrolase of the HAD superfamily